MPIPRRRFAALIAIPAVLLATLLASCGTTTAPTALPSAPAPVLPTVPVPSLDDAGVAYGRAMCPVFASMIELDPELAALRELGASGGDVPAAAEDLESASADLLALMTALEEMPSWAPGAQLQFHLISALHVIRTHLAAIAADPGAADASERLAELPFVASDAMDRAMQEAVAGGLTCEPES